jgi:hypothetical protein
MHTSIHVLKSIHKTRMGKALLKDMRSKTKIATSGSTSWCIQPLKICHSEKEEWQRFLIMPFELIRKQKHGKLPQSTMDVQKLYKQNII